MLGGLLVVGLAIARPLLARLASRNIARRKVRVLIVVAGLLVGTAIISASLVVGDTLSYVFVEDVYIRYDAIDELVTNEFNGNLYSFPEARFEVFVSELASRGTRADGIAPVLLKVMPVRNEAGNKGNQQISVMGLNASYEFAFGPLRTRDGRVVDTGDLADPFVYLNERAVRELNASVDDPLTLFYGTTGETLVHVVVKDIVLDEGKAGYERRPIIFMGLRQAQAAFNEAGQVNLIKVSNLGGVADGVAYSDDVARALELVIAQNHWELRVEKVKADGIAEARAFGSDATELFLVMGAFAIVAGVLLIVNIFVMLAEERKSEMGVSRAVGFLRRDLLAAFLVEGTAYVGLAAALGAMAGLALGYAIIYFFDRLVPHGEVQITFFFEPGSVLLAFAAGATLTWLTMFVASWRASRLNIVRAIRDLPEPPPEKGSRRMLLASVGLLALGASLIAYGVWADTGYGRIPGPPLLGYGSALLAATWSRARLGFTAASVFALAWILQPAHLLNDATDNISVAFVLTGLVFVGSAILLAVFNVSEVLRWSLTRARGRVGRPVLRTAVSYPAEKRFRTAMTVAMFALILFMVTLISMVQSLQQSSLDSFLAEQSGGYDVIGYTTTYGEIPTFRQILQGNFSESQFLGGWQGVASASVLPAKVQASGSNESFDYTLWGVDNFLLRSNQYGFYSYLPTIVGDDGVPYTLGTREEVWLSLSRNRSLAIVDRSAAGANQFIPDENRLRVSPGDRIRVYDGSGNEVNLTIVGVLEQALQFTAGVFVDQSVVSSTFPPEGRFTAYFFQVAAGVDVRSLRADLERVFFAYGLQTIDIREEVGQAFEASQQVLTLMQAYLGIGLVVGIAGLAVVTLRAVVERRQQIGALRAIGFTQRMVLSMFLVEICLVALLGILIGIVTGILFTYKVYLVYFADIVTFSIPWANLMLIVAVATAAALAATAAPAIQASRLPPAKALRFAE